MKKFFKKIQLPILLSLFLHFFVFYFGNDILNYFSKPPADEFQKPLLPDYEKPRAQVLPLRVINENEFREIVETKKLSPLPNVKDKAKYYGEQTQRVSKETRSKDFGSPLADNRSSKSNSILKELAPTHSLWKIPSKEENSPKSSHDNLSKLNKGSMDLLNREIAIGADTVLNTDEYIYASFFNRLKQEIGPRWEPKVQQFFRSTLTLGDGVYSTRYAFYLDDEGNLLDIEPLEASGSGTLDSIAAQAIREVARFPNPPSMLKVKGRHKVVFGFIADYSRNRFLPKYEPDRRYLR